MNARYRTTWRGSLVLQIKVTERRFVMYEGWKEKTYWRDAKLTDLAPEFWKE